MTTQKIVNRMRVSSRLNTFQKGNGPANIIITWLHSRVGRGGTTKGRLFIGE